MSFVKLKGFAAIVLLALTFTVQSPPPAQAGWGWLCWWCGPPSAISLIDARPILSRQPENVRNYLASLITKYRNFNAPEEDVKIFIDNLEKQYKLKEGSLQGGSIFNTFSGLFISSAHANPAICLVPYIGQVGCAAAAQLAKKAVVETGKIVVKNKKAIAAMIAATGIVAMSAEGYDDSTPTTDDRGGAIPSDMPTCTLNGSTQKPGSILNDSKHCWKCNYKCVGKGMAGGGMFITRYQQFGQCAQPLGAAWIRGWVLAHECDEAAEDSRTKHPLIVM